MLREDYIRMIKDRSKCSFEEAEKIYGLAEDKAKEIGGHPEYYALRFCCTGRF